MTYFFVIGFCLNFQKLELQASENTMFGDGDNQYSPTQNSSQDGSSQKKKNFKLQNNVTMKVVI